MREKPKKKMTRENGCVCHCGCQRRVRSSHSPRAFFRPDSAGSESLVTLYLFRSCSRDGRSTEKKIDKPLSAICQMERMKACS